MEMKPKLFVMLVLTRAGAGAGAGFNIIKGGSCYSRFQNIFAPRHWFCNVYNKYDIRNLIRSTFSRNL